MRHRRSRTLQIALVAVVLCGAAAATLLVDPFSGEALARARQAWTTGGTIHARFFTAAGDLVAEEWLDKTTGMTRRVQFGGEEGAEITVQDGTRSVSWNSLGFGAIYEAVAIEPGDPWLVRSSSLLRFKRLIEDGRIQVVGTRTVRGSEAIVVEPEQGPDFTAGAVVEVALDATTLLPVEASSEVDGVRSTFRVESEALGARLSSELFAPPGPATIVDRRLRMSELESHGIGFTAYELARPPGKLRLGTIGLRRQTDPEAPLVPQPHLFVGYVRRDTFEDPTLELVQRAADTDEARAELDAFADADVRKFSAGTDTFSVSLLGGDEGPVAFALLREGTLITGYADLPIKGVMKALKSLQEAEA